MVPLPAGVSFTPNANGTATISGNPGTTGVFTITIHATNGIGAPASQVFTERGSGALFTSANTTTFLVGTLVPSRS